MTAASLSTPEHPPATLLPATPLGTDAPRAAPPTVPTRRRGPATYSELTRSAATALAEALVSCDAQAWSVAGLRESVAAHRHLTARLVLLGGALATPPTPGRFLGQPARRTTADTRLLRQLEALAQPRDWSAPAPPPGSTPAHLHRAADLVGAAAELWTTHHDPAGLARSPEACRLRHPATLGAATREWRDLVLVAGAMADVLVGVATTLLPADDRRTELVQGLAGYPEPGRRRDRGPRDPLAVTVARPLPGASDDLQAMRERVRHLRHVAWRLGVAGLGPVPVIANLAAIGVLLHQAAAAGLQQEPSRLRHGSDPEPATCTSERADAGADAWHEVCRAVEQLRSPHPPQTAVQVERLDLRRLIERVLQGADRDPGSTSPDVANALAELASEFDLVAPDLLRGVRAAAGRGEVYVRGRALTNDLLPRSPELLEAKLRDGIAPAPTALVRRLEAALYRVSRPARDRGDESAPPAA